MVENKSFLLDYWVFSVAFFYAITTCNTYTILKVTLIFCLGQSPIQVTFTCYWMGLKPAHTFKEVMFGFSVLRFILSDDSYIHFLKLLTLPIVCYLILI